MRIIRGALRGFRLLGSLCFLGWEMVLWLARSSTDCRCNAGCGIERHDAQARHCCRCKRVVTTIVAMRLRLPLPAKPSIPHPALRILCSAAPCRRRCTSSHPALPLPTLQVGCAMGCTFCATGTMGLTADLTAGEIVEQLVHARRVAQIRNIVFMVGWEHCISLTWPVACSGDAGQLARFVD